MNPTEVIAKTIAEKRTALTEAEAKAVLKNYNIPVVDEIIYNDINDLHIAAPKISYPVVLKGLGSKLTHKTEKGLVKLNIKTQKDLLAAAVYIKEAAGDDLEGFLLQPMLEGKRELVAGLFLTRSSVRRSCSGWGASLRRPLVMWFFVWRLSMRERHE